MCKWLWRLLELQQDSRRFSPGSALLRPTSSRHVGAPGGTFTRDWVSPSNGALNSGISGGGYLISPALDSGALLFPLAGTGVHVVRFVLN